ncbi:MAG TPA: hypothetical protein VEC93_18700 [Anaerolineae bacterium]|nr:hypothetical protein [Anaerolineae bacterium]
MITTMINGQLPQIDKAVQLNDKMLELAQDLFLEELADDSLFACGDDFTSKLAGKYGSYETFNGEVISFQPKASLNFTLISDEFAVTGDLASIKTISHRLTNYELSINGS